MPAPTECPRCHQWSFQSLYARATVRNRKTHHDTQVYLQIGLICTAWDCRYVSVPPPDNPSATKDFPYWVNKHNRAIRFGRIKEEDPE